MQCAVLDQTSSIDSGPSWHIRKASTLSLTVSVSLGAASGFWMIPSFHILAFPKPRPALLGQSGRTPTSGWKRSGRQRQPLVRGDSQSLDPRRSKEPLLGNGEAHGRGGNIFRKISGSSIAYARTDSAPTRFVHKLPVGKPSQRQRP